MSLRRSLGWAFSGQVITFIASFAGSVIVAHLLTPREMGVFALANATTGILAVISTAGVSAYVVRAEFLDQKVLTTAFTVNAILSGVLASAIALIGLVSLEAGDTPEVGQALLVLAISPLLNLFEFRADTLLQREMRYRLLSSLMMLKAVINSLLVVLFAYAGMSYMSMPYASVIVSVIGAVAFNIAVREHFSLRLSLDGWRPIARFGLHMLSISGVSRVTARLSEIILARLLGLAALGLYMRAASLATLLFDQLYGTATRVFFSQMAKDLRERSSLRDRFEKALQMIGATMAPIQMAIAVLSGPIIYRLFGDQWLAAAMPLTILMIAQVIALGFSMNWELFVLRDETARQSKFEMARAAVGLVAFTAGCLVSLAGAAAGRLLECLFGLVLYTPHMARLSDVPRYKLLSIYGTSLLLGLVATAPVTLLMFAYSWSPAVPLLSAAGAIAVGVLAWFITLLGLRHPLVAEMRRGFAAVRARV